MWWTAHVPGRGARANIVTYESQCSRSGLDRSNSLEHLICRSYFHYDHGDMRSVRSARTLRNTKDQLETALQPSLLSHESARYFELRNIVMHIKRDKDDISAQRLPQDLFKCHYLDARIPSSFLLTLLVGEHFRAIPSHIDICAAWVQIFSVQHLTFNLPVNISLRRRLRLRLSLYGVTRCTCLSYPSS